jgi:dihydropteroate synthase
MEYHEAARYVTSFRRSRPKLGTETTARMLSGVGDPQLDVDCVQIAGSNGKGSTARMLESVLRHAGLRVGLFVSPGLNGFREQVRVDGTVVPKSRIVEYVRALRPCIERLREEDDEPTRFEMLTAIALQHFSERNVDVAVLEVGLGGRDDATSVVEPVASAVTSVSLEHTAVLGDTVEEIARNKAHVAPTDAPLVTGAEGAALEAVREMTDVVTVGPDRGDRRSSVATSVPDVVAVETEGGSDVESGVSISGSDWRLETTLSLRGPHQATNAGIAATLARQVASVDPTTVADGLRATTCPGRFETVSTDPKVVLDGAHNPSAAATLSGLLDRYEYENLHLVFAAMADKAYDRMLAALPSAERAYATRPNRERAEATDALADALAPHASVVAEVPSVTAATERAVDAAASDDVVLVTGSLYAVAEARPRWTAPPDSSVVEASAGTDVPSPKVPGNAGHRLVDAGADERDR